MCFGLFWSTFGHGWKAFGRCFEEVWEVFYCSGEGFLLCLGVFLSLFDVFTVVGSTFV